MSFPFAAVVGQDAARLALLLAAVRPGIGGVLLRGEKGTAKSTLVRGLAELLPGTPLVTLPLGATEDRLLGGLDMARTVATGAPVLQPGLLAAVDGGILYVDEVNLLSDHLADVVLDAVAAGQYRLEREGLSVVGPCRCVLVGSMNPEEGELRPQLLDRFGLCVDVLGEQDEQIRARIINLILDHDRDPNAMMANYVDETQRMADRVAAARRRQVVCPAHIEAWIAEICVGGNVAGHRADLVLAEAARAHAAWHGRRTVTVADVTAMIEPVLVHRRRDADIPPPPPSEPEDSESEDSQEADESPPEDQTADQPSGADSSQSRQSPADQSADESQRQDQVDPTPPEPDQAPPDDSQLPEPGSDQIAGIGATFTPKRLRSVSDRIARTGSGRRQVSRSANRQGRYVRALPTQDADDLALDATLRAAAVHQVRRRQPGSKRLVVTKQDWHRKVRMRKVGALVLFVVDASGSMAARGRMIASKGAVLSLLIDAYQKRDRVGLISFRRGGAEVLLAPTSSVSQAQQLLAELPTGGRTCIVSGLEEAIRVIRPLLIKEPELRPIVILVSDGRANVAIESGVDPWAETLTAAQVIGADDRIRWVVVDTEDPAGVRLRRAGPLASNLGAQLFTLADLQDEAFASHVKGLS